MPLEPLNIIQDWQTVAALAIVTVAFGVLLRKAWQTFRGGSVSGCGTSCESCPSSSDEHDNAPKVIELVQLDSSAPVLPADLNRKS